MGLGMQQVRRARLGHPLQHQPDTAILIAQHLGMHQGQIEKLPGGFINPQIPPTIDGHLGRRAGQMIGLKRPAIFAKHIPGKLVQQDDIGQGTGRIGQPHAIGPVTGGLPCWQKPVADLLIQRVRAVVPPLFPDRVEPKGQNIVRAHHGFLPWMVCAAILRNSRRSYPQPVAKVSSK